MGSCGSTLVCLNMWFFPWGILTRYENLNGKWWWIMEMVRGSLFSDVNPQMGFPAVDWNHQMANKHGKFWGSPCLLLKWFVSGYSRNLWRKSTGTSNSHIYIYIQGSPSKALNVCFAFSTTHSGSKLWPLQLCSSGWMNPSAATSRTKRIAIW